MVAGTTTFANDAVAALADRKGLGERGYFEGQAQPQRDPDNPVDPQAVAVLVDGEKVGCLPSYVAKNLPLPAGADMQVRLSRGIDERAPGFVVPGVPFIVCRPVVV